MDNLSFQKSSTSQLTLIHNPVILIHGYKASKRATSNLESYLVDKAFICTSFEYDSSKPISYSSDMFSSFINNYKKELLDNDIYCNTVDIVCHSMGGLIIRYYTCNQIYIKKNDINKIIFVAVPHNGTNWAYLGENIFNDLGIIELQPDSSLFNDYFPNSNNKGLNNTIQTGNIALDNDEIVSVDSSSLIKWKVNTVFFHIINDSPISIDSIFDYNNFIYLNHNNILNNTPFFNKILEMLHSKLRYPSKIN